MKLNATRPFPLPLIPHLIATFFPIPTCRAAFGTKPHRRSYTALTTLSCWIGPLVFHPSLWVAGLQSQRFSRNHRKLEESSGDPPVHPQHLQGMLSHLRDAWKFFRRIHNHNKHPSISPCLHTLSIGIDRKTGNVWVSLASLKLSTPYRITSWETQDSTPLSNSLDRFQTKVLLPTSCSFATPGFFLNPWSQNPGII